MFFLYLHPPIINTFSASILSPTEHASCQWLGQARSLFCVSSLALVTDCRQRQQAMPGFEQAQKRMGSSDVVFGRGEDPEDAQVTCVFCGAAGPASTLDCLHCHSAIPFCLATGKSSSKHLKDSLQSLLLSGAFS